MNIRARDHSQPEGASCSQSRQQDKDERNLASGALTALQSDDGRPGVSGNVSFLQAQQSQQPPLESAMQTIPEGQVKNPESKTEQTHNDSLVSSAHQATTLLTADVEKKRHLEKEDDPSLQLNTKKRKTDNDLNQEGGVMKTTLYSTEFYTVIGQW